MRVVVAGPLPPIRSGIAQHTAGVIEGFIGLGMEVVAVTWRSQYPAFLYPGPTDSRVSAFGFDATPVLHWARPWTWYRGGKRARSGDLLVLPWVTPIQAAPIAALIRAARPTPTAVIVHNALPHERRPFDVALTKWALKNVSGAVVHSQAVARDLATIVPALSSVRVQHPPNLRVPPKALPTNDRVRFLFAGLIRPYKGVDVAIEAMGILRQRDVKAELTIAGEFWEPVEKYRQMVSEMELGNSVVLQPGYVEDASLSALIQNHHVVLLPYRTASQSGLLPIALGAERPVVASNVGGLSEDVDHGVTGLLVEPGIPAALAEAMEEMCISIDAFAERVRDWRPTEWTDVARALLDVSKTS